MQQKIFIFVCVYSTKPFSANRKSNYVSNGVRQVLSFDSLRPQMKNDVPHDYSFSDYWKRMEANDKTDSQVGRLQLPSEASPLKLTVDRLQN